MGHLQSNAEVQKGKYLRILCLHLRTDFLGK